jgi:hypothetical protein
MCKVFSLMGVTCVGKDYFIERACEQFPHLFGKVQVGKELRKRHSPEYFKGLGCATACYQEALDILKEQYEVSRMVGHKYVLVSGQPRERSQVQPVIDILGSNFMAIWLSADENVIMNRLKDRFKDDPASEELALQRLKNDRVQLYDSFFELLHRGIDVRTVDVTYTDINHIIQQIAHFGEF